MNKRGDQLVGSCRRRKALWKDGDISCMAAAAVAFAFADSELIGLAIPTASSSSLMAG